MISNHIHDALNQVRTLQEFVLARRRFRGYSGRARIVCGVTALAGAAVMSSDFIPVTASAHLLGWGVVLLIALSVSYAGLLIRIVSVRHDRGGLRELKPAVDALPALAAGALISAALIRSHQYDLLPGSWMLLYGLAQTAYRGSMEPGIYAVGLMYMAAGAICLLLPGLRFVNPWPMGIVFFAGELCGGVVMLKNNRQAASPGSVTSGRNQ
jgi:hypothetical protein